MGNTGYRKLSCKTLHKFGLISYKSLLYISEFAVTITENYVCIFNEYRTHPEKAISKSLECIL